MASPTPKEKAFAAQLAKLSFLVADPSPARNGIRGMLSQIGVKPSQVQVVEMPGDLMTVIQKHKPNVLFIDINMIASNATAVVDAQKAAISAGSTRVLCLLSSGEANLGNTDAIEDDIDATILKPFTTDGLKMSVTTLLDEKLNPSPYRKLMDEGKELAQIGKKEDALVRFQKAKALNPQLPYAVHYEGLMHWQLGRVAEARASFQDNAKKNPGHYPSLVGLLDVLLKEENLPAAYEIARVIATKHPLPIKRLPELIKLSVLSSNFDDILGYYKAAEAIQASEVDVATHMASALVVCGLHFLKTGKKDAALDAFRKAEVMGKGNSKVLKRILIALTQAGMQADTKSFMMRASDEVKNAPELQIAELDFLLAQPDKKEALDFAIALAQKNFPDPKVYHTAIGLSIEHKRKATNTKGIISIAVRAFPDKEDEFRAYEPKLPKD